MIETDKPRDVALLVGVELPNQDTPWTLEDSMAELAQLARTVDVEVVATLTQTLHEINPATLIGKGKVEELIALCTASGANIVIFDEELSPRQQRVLEKLLGLEIKLLDRTALILDIFAQHASTREGALQVELAQYEYRRPRLTRQWTHLARQAGGGGGRGGNAGVGLRGPGETQLEVDKREIVRRITHLKHELEEVRKHRQQYRQRRRQAAIPVVSLVGYTNAGKSTLLNALTGAAVYAADQLFATLDPTTRRLVLPGGREVLLTDTVGFIQKLPTDLVAAFRATLEEVSEADLLLHVVDITHQNALEQAETVGEVLAEIGATDKPIVTALNKIDRLLPDESERTHELRARFPDGIPVSALTGEGLEKLIVVIEELLTESFTAIKVHIPYREGELVALFHQRGLIEEEKHDATGTTLVGRLPERVAPLFARYRR
ncbi:MAG: GTPase HflX [Anaerolineae bacterium]|uniref:GTPase HflX n=1 Tax=Candidatus Amarolinea dominans TaxID=3140696 RepID=UPI0031CC7690